MQIGDACIVRVGRVEVHWLAVVGHRHTKWPAEAPNAVGEGIAPSGFNNSSCVSSGAPRAGGGEYICNYEAKRHSPTCFGMQPNHGGCLLCCYTGYLGIFSSFLV